MSSADQEECLAECFGEWEGVAKRRRVMSLAEGQVWCRMHRPRLRNMHTRATSSRRKPVHAPRQRLACLCSVGQGRCPRCDISPCCRCMPQSPASTRALSDPRADARDSCCQGVLCREARLEVAPAPYPATPNPSPTP
eukprot:1799891-Rhodomonas_salina.2